MTEDLGPHNVPTQVGLTTPPRNLTSLRARFRNIAAGELAINRLERAVANVVLAQMLPPGAVKGGTGIKLRLGHGGSRFTPDLDVARRSTMGQFLTDYTAALTTGWAGFTGRLVPVRAAKPVGVPAPYVMQPYDIKVAYHSRAWMTVRLEVGHDEIGDTDKPDFVLAGDLAAVFTRLGLPEPAPVAVLSVDHQIAQKLHACSAPGSERAHDLVDLQLLMSEPVDLDRVRATCERLFASRRAHSWPPTVHAGSMWPAIYPSAAEGIDGLVSMDDAVMWVNALIRQIAPSS
ncbi:MAG: nucleotidyl transferase AbiEii/AbiGii toxin family protein [Dermatophilaceae bacterium]